MQKRPDAGAPRCRSAPMQGHHDAGAPRCTGAAMQKRFAGDHDRWYGHLVEMDLWNYKHTNTHGP